MQYDEIQAVRRSALWEIRKSPLHYVHAVTTEEEPTPALLFGIAAHMHILEPERFDEEYIVAPRIDRRTKEGKELWANLQASGKSILSEADMEQIRLMDAAIERNPTARVLLRTGEHEVPVTWTDPETGEACKCRPDVITIYNGETYIVDYKTTTSCADGAFEKACRLYGYKLQAGMYTEGVFNSTLMACKFAFVAQEKTAPYACRVYICDEGFISEGADLFHELLGIYHNCKLTGEWPGYADKELLGDD